MKGMKKFLAVSLAGAMTLSMAACGSDSSTTDSSTSTESSDASASSSDDSTLVIAQDDFSEKFSSFFCTTVYDERVANMVGATLITTDRAGEVIYNGIEGETKEYNGTEYTYTSLSDLTVTENEDGTVEYDFKLRDDVTFSDGEPLTADDVIFTMYVYSDPSYDGSSSLYSLPITGMDAYRNGSTTLLNLLLENGEDNTDFTYYTQEEQEQFFGTDLPAAGEAFAQSIADYCTTNGYTTGVESIDASDIANGMANWGYGTINDDGSLTGPYTGTTWTMEGDDVPTAADFWAEMLANVGEGLGYEDILTMADTEKASDSLADFLDDSYKNSIETGSSVDYIEGIEKVNDYEVKVTLDSVDAAAIYQFGFNVCPLHYYGSDDEYDYDNHKFGFTKGDLSTIREKTTTPLGAGPYVFQKYENKTVYFTANESYFKGAPVTKNVQFKVTSNADKITGVVQGTVDIADPSGSKEALTQIAEQNSNGETTGDTLTTTLYDTLGYGYIGMNSQNVKVGDDPSSEESKDLRKAIATVIAVYRDVVIDSYYGDAASVINYPISNTSWAAPQASDPDYEVAFSKDVDGNEIYTDSMTEDEKYAAALEAALGYFEAAGYTVSDGKLTAAPDGASLSYEVMIPGGGSGDHPSFGIITAASEALATIGFDLEINDLSDSTILWSSTESGTAELWCAAWGATLDPDMFQVYHSNGGSAYMYRIYSDELDAMIEDARTSTDQTYRKAVYKECLDFIVDYAVEIPVYQRQDVTIFSSTRIDTDSLPGDMTTFYSFYAEIEKIAMK